MSTRSAVAVLAVAALTGCGGRAGGGDTGATNGAETVSGVGSIPDDSAPASADDSAPTIGEGAESPAPWVGTGAGAHASPPSGAGTGGWAPSGGGTGGIGGQAASGGGTGGIGGQAASGGGTGGIGWQVASCGSGGGQSTDPPECSYPLYPESDWVPPEWVQDSPPPESSATALLDRMRMTMVGSWHGLARTPWTTAYEVDLTFRENGSYSGHCSDLADDCCTAFYYGTNDDTPLKLYRVQDISLSGEIFGEIDIAFDYGPGQYGLPVWQGEVYGIERDQSGDGLRFRFATSSGYGPIEYDLRRVVEE